MLTLDHRAPRLLSRLRRPPRERQTRESRQQQQPLLREPRASNPDSSDSRPSSTFDEIPVSSSSLSSSSPSSSSSLSSSSFSPSLSSSSSSLSSATNSRLAEVERLCLDLELNHDKKKERNKIRALERLQALICGDELNDKRFDDPRVRQEMTSKIVAAVLAVIRGNNDIDNETATTVLHMCCQVLCDLAQYDPSLLLLQDGSGSHMMKSLQITLKNSSCHPSPKSRDDRDVHATVILTVVSTIELFLRLQPDATIIRASGETTNWIDAIHEAWKSRPGCMDIVHPCLQIFDKLSAQASCVNDVANTNELAETLLNSMATKDMFSVQISCNILINVMKAVPAFKRLVANQFGFGTLVSALSSSSSGSVVQEAACKALCLLTASTAIKEEEIQRVLVDDVGVVEALARTSLTVGDTNRDLQDDIITAIGKLSLRVPQLREGGIEKARGAECIVLAMGKYPDDENIQENGAIALWSLCMDERNDSAVCDEGGVEAVLYALCNHRNSITLVKNCLGALNAMSAYGPSQQRISDFDGGKGVVILQALTDHGNDDSKVQKFAFAALSNVAAYHSENRNPMSVQVLEKAVEALQNRSLSIDTMEVIWRLLCNYSLHSTHKEWMLQCSLFQQLLSTTEASGSQKCEEYRVKIRGVLGLPLQAPQVSVDS